MKEIELTKGQIAIVDDADFGDLSKFNWRVDGKGYAVRKILRRENLNVGRTIGMHRFLMGLTHGDKREVDHIDGNPLNNQRKNLRVCLAIENLRNKKKSINNTSGFKGVTFHKKTGKWQAQIRRGDQFKYLGLYESSAEAHEVYCLWADMLHGEFANHGLKEAA